MPIWKIKKINKVLEIPKEVYTNEPKLVIIGFNELIIENYKGILEYEEFYIKLNTFIGIININGFNLKLEKINIITLTNIIDIVIKNSNI